ncbi:MAG: 2Fe-2S iron-sulfur cluster-binding protein [Alphaproteobacteria bacterium]
MSSGRLPEPAGALIDRSRSVDFTFCGRRYAGFAGDTIASALAANGVRVLSRSFKYHRPRGLLTACGQDANSLIQVGDEPNLPADVRRIEPGMVATAQNVFGSLEHDRAAVLGKLGRFLPVGFYYKAFYKPKGSWPYWERIIRRLAGLGTVNLGAHHGYYDKAYLFCDVAVVGGGPAGMAAALVAAKGGGEVLLIEENPILGGSLNYARFEADDKRASRERHRLVGEVEATPNIDVMTDAVCTGWFADNFLSVIKGTRLYKLRARAVVVAAGSFEQPLVFRNNDLPGVMMGSAVERLIRLFGVRPGRRAVVATANADGYAVALDLIEAGVEVACVVDLRQSRPDGDCVKAVADQGVPMRVHSTVWEALPAPGLGAVKGARVARIDGEGRCEGVTDRFACDLIVMSVGYHPTANLILHAGGKLRYNDETAMFEVTELPPHLFAAGSAGGAYNLDAVIEDGRIAGWEAANDVGLKVGRRPVRKNDPGALGQSHPWPIFQHPKGRDFVDFDEDLQVHDLLDAIAEGYDHIELLKRFSTVGMGPSQGRHSAVNAARICAKATGRSVNEVGTTTSRPPFAPEKFAHLAGRSFEPVRLTSIHHRHLELGAKMMVAGAWLRPEYYGPRETRGENILREVVNVRQNVGLMDVSTLGGMEVRGPDAAEFLERIYTFAYAKQPAGRVRYVLMTDMAGVITDDGVACRFHDHHFYVTATTSGADAVYQTMLFYNAQWCLDVVIANVTASYCAINIAGPRSRAVLAKLCDDVDLSPEAFPYMNMRTGTVAGIPARLVRIGFVGELGYEIHAPASQAEALWDALMKAGEEFGIVPFGIEAQRVLRLEKGHIIIGQDTDGLTNPHEAEMTWAISRKKPYFVGKRSIDMQVAGGVERKLIGFTLVDGQAPMPKECHLVIRDGEITGRVTSVARSPALDNVIGLAYVAEDQAEVGNRVEIRVDGGRLVEAEVVKLPFYDPEGKRQEM